MDAKGQQLLVSGELSLVLLVNNRVVIKLTMRMIFSVLVAVFGEISVNSKLCNEEDIQVHRSEIKSLSSVGVRALTHHGFCFNNGQHIESFAHTKYSAIMSHATTS